MIKIWKMLNRKKIALIIFLISLEAIGFLILPSLAAEVLNASALAGDTGRVIRISLIMLVATLVTIVIAFASTRFSAQESQGLGNTLRKKLFNRIMSFSQEDISKFGTSTLITRTTNDVMQIQLVTMMMLRLIIMSPIVMVVSFLFALQREAQLAWVFAITIPMIVVIVTIIMRLANPIFRSIQFKTDRLNSVFREGLTGIRVIRAFNTTEYEENRFDAANSDFRNTSIKANSILALILPTMLLTMGLTNVLTFMGGANLIAVDEMEIGNLIAFTQYGVQILMSILQVAMLLFFLPRAEVSAERILEVIESEPTIENNDHALTWPENRDLTLEFDDVCFGFPGAEREAIFDLNFTAKAGETIAIIGGTGSGKTTIANLIPRLYEASCGSIKVSGIDVRNLDQNELRQHIGYAPQKALLFSGTIRSNLQYGKADASEEEMLKALEIAQADFVYSLDGGLDARVEQGGQNFSGGQRQRLSIARAIVSKPDIYIFDDSFSALDFKTDANLRAALKPETAAAITVIIAQRVNTVIGADRILVLDQGQIIGQGSHDELLETNEIYQDIVDSQMKGDDQ